MRNLISKLLMLCMCVLVILGNSIGFGIVVRIALGAVGVGMLVDVILELRRLLKKNGTDGKNE